MPPLPRVPLRWWTKTLSTGNTAGSDFQADWYMKASVPHARQAPPESFLPFGDNIRFWFLYPAIYLYIFFIKHVILTAIIFLLNFIEQYYYKLLTTNLKQVIFNIYSLLMSYLGEYSLICNIYPQACRDSYSVYNQTLMHYKKQVWATFPV